MRLSATIAMNTNNKMNQTETNRHNTQMSTTVKLKSWGKNLPTLNEKNAVLWKFKADMFIRGTNGYAATVILKEQISEDVKSSSSSATTVSSARTEALEWLKKNDKEEKFMKHIYQELTETLPEEETMLIMDIPYPNAEKVYETLVGHYNINTRLSRFKKIAMFFHMTMEADETFTKFVQRINTAANQINGMQGKEVDITDTLKLVVLIEGVQEYHGDTFSVTTQLIEQDSNSTYQDAVNKMRPVARRLELQQTEKANAATEANAATAHNKKRVDNKENEVGGKVCYSYRSYGTCPRGAACPFDHKGKPGTKKCENCNGKHPTKYCKEKGKEKVKVATEENYNHDTGSDVWSCNYNYDTDSNSDSEDYTAEQAKVAKLERNALWGLKTKMENETTTTEDEADAEHQTAKPRNFLFPLGAVFIALAIVYQYFIDTGVKMEELPSQIWSTCFASNSPSTTPSLAGIVAPVVTLLYTTRRTSINKIILYTGLVLLLLSGMLQMLTTPETQIYDVKIFNGIQERTGTTDQIITEGCFVGRNTLTGHLERSQWHVDSGCTSHICNKLDMFREKSLKPHIVRIELAADGSYMSSQQKGTVVIKTQNSQGVRRTLKLEGALYVPSSASNLISVSKLLQTQHKIVFDTTNCTILNKANRQSIVIPMLRNMFTFSANYSKEKGTEQKCKVADSHGNLSKTDLLHQRWCHPSEKYIRKACPEIKPGTLTCGCTACIKGGIQRKPYHKKPTKDQQPKVSKRMEKVMADTCTPFPKTKSTYGNKVFFIIMDIFSRKTWIIFAKSKAEFPQKYRTWLTQVENETKLKPVLFMPDGGTEFDNKNLKDFLEKTGTKFETTSPGNPNQNPWVERVNGVIQTKMKKILLQANLPDRYWEDAAKFVVEIQNAMPHSGLGYDSPNHRWDPNKKDKTLQYARVFGCTVWYMLNNSKTLPKGSNLYRKGMYLGTADTGNGYKILDLATRKIVKTRDAYFSETEFPYAEPKSKRVAQVVEEENETTVIVPPPGPSAREPDADNDQHQDFNGGDDEEQINFDDIDEHDDYDGPQDDPLQEANNSGDMLDQKHDSPVLNSEEDEDHEPRYNLRETAFRKLANADRRNPPNPGPANSSKGGRRTWEVESIVDRRDTEQGTDYLVKWKGEYDNSWVPAENLRRSKEAVEMYNASNVDLPTREQVNELQGERAVPTDEEVAASAVSHKEVPELGTNFRKWNQKQTRKSSFNAQFQEAEMRELTCIKKHGTWKVVKIPGRGKVPITCRWVYDVKRDADNNIVMFKARLTAHGFKQQEGVDFNETFSAVAQMKSFRVTLALSQLLGLRMTQIDVSNAFLHGVLEEEVYMTAPPGYEHLCPPGTCLKLEKGLYGLKQAGRVWNQCLTSSLQTIGFKPLISDSQVMKLERKVAGKKIICIIGIHVDDITISTSDESLRKEVMTLLQEKFLVKDLGEISHYLGIKVDTSNNETKLSQSAYIDKILASFEMEKCNPAPTPGATNMQLSKDDCPSTPEERQQMQKVPFRSLIGSMMYAYIGTRPDIGACLMKVAAFCENPGQMHWRAAKRILRYLKGAKAEEIVYSGRLLQGEKVRIEVYSDSDWAQDVDDRKSVSGWVVKIAGGPVSWQSKKQPTRALSSCEAEFISLCEATREVIWLTQFLTELGIEHETPMMFTDSQSAMEWSRNAGNHQRTKHVALKYFFVRDAVQNKRVKLAYISTKENEADILTKSTTAAVFKYLKPKLHGTAKAFVGIIGKGVRWNIGYSDILQQY